MRIIISILGNLFSPIFIGFAKHFSESKMFKHKGVEVWCKSEYKEVVKESIDNVSEFYQSKWNSYQNNIKRIIINPELISGAWISKRTLVVKSDDTSRLSSVTHFSSWLISDYERIETFKNLHCLHVPWNYRVFNLAQENAIQSRKEYLAER